MEIIEVIEKDSVCTVVFEASDEEYNLLLRAGIQAIIDENGYKIIVQEPMPDALDDKNIKKYDLSDEEAHFLMETGFNSILRKHIELEESLEPKKKTKVAKKKTVKSK